MRRHSGGKKMVEIKTIQTRFASLVHLLTCVNGYKLHSFQGGINAFLTNPLPLSFTVPFEPLRYLLASPQCLNNGLQVVHDTRFTKQLFFEMSGRGLFFCFFVFFLEEKSSLIRGCWYLVPNLLSTPPLL